MYTKTFVPLENINNLSSYKNVDAILYLHKDKKIMIEVGEEVDAYHFISSLGHNTNDKGVAGFIIGISNKINGKFVGHYACMIKVPH